MNKATIHFRDQDRKPVVVSFNAGAVGYASQVVLDSMRSGEVIKIANVILHAADVLYIEVIDEGPIE